MPRERTRRFSSHESHEKTLTETSVEKSAEIAQKSGRFFGPAGAAFLPDPPRRNAGAPVRGDPHGMKKIIPLLLQSLVTLGIVLFFCSYFFFKTWEELAAANPVWLAAGFGAAGVVNFLGAFRWGIFLRVLGVRLPAWQVLRLSFVGLFFNIFLVGAVGGDAVKVVWLVAKGHPKTPALLSVFMDRMSGFARWLSARCSSSFCGWIG